MVMWSAHFEQGAASCNAFRLASACQAALSGAYRRLGRSGRCNRMWERGSPAATSAGAAPMSGLGTPFAFTDASNGANVSTITFTEIALAPAECLTELLPGRVALAVRSQVESIGTSRMSQPDQWPLSTVDRAGITQLDRARHSLCLGQGPDSNVWTVLNTRVTRMLGATILLDFRVTPAAIAFHPHGFRP
ncbi:hypothetical protein [Nocardia salmonicida]|uniref:hypothetical protein n=1 Tax=Nocardia salmonicida TaxID=53431 RepID=UPI0034164413